jgi:hypothetical protein
MPTVHLPSFCLSPWDLSDFANFSPETLFFFFFLKFKNTCHLHQNCGCTGESLLSLLTSTDGILQQGVPGILSVDQLGQNYLNINTQI